MAQVDAAGNVKLKYGLAWKTLVAVEFMMGGLHRLQVLLLLLFGSGKTLVAVEFMVALAPVLQKGKIGCQ